MVTIHFLNLYKERERRQSKREDVLQHPSALFLAGCWISAKQQVGFPFILFGQQMKKKPNWSNFIKYKMLRRVRPHTERWNSPQGLTEDKQYESVRLWEGAWWRWLRVIRKAKVLKELCQHNTCLASGHSSCSGMEVEMDSRIDEQARIPIPIAGAIKMSLILCCSVELLSGQWKESECLNEEQSATGNVHLYFFIKKNW